MKVNYSTAYEELGYRYWMCLRCYDVDEHHFIAIDELRDNNDNGLHYAVVILETGDYRMAEVVCITKNYTEAKLHCHSAIIGSHESHV